MAPGGQRGLCLRVPPDRWRAQRHRFNLRMRREGLFQAVVGRHSIDRTMPAHRGHQLHIGTRGDGGHVLVAGDLADADKGNAQCVWMLHRNLRADRDVAGPARSPVSGTCTETGAAARCNSARNGAV